MLPHSQAVPAQIPPIMHFAIAFEAAIKAKHLSQEKASAACGMHQTAVSRYLRGDIPKADNLNGILAVFDDDKSTRRQLIYAYVRDILEEASIEPEEVTLKTGGAPNLADCVDPELYAALSAIALSAKHNASTRDMVLHMALVVAQPRTEPVPGRKSPASSKPSDHDRNCLSRRRSTAAVVDRFAY